MKKVILGNSVLAGLCGVAMNAYAIGNGFYLGMQLGPATSKASQLQATRLYGYSQAVPGGPWVSDGTPTPNPTATKFFTTPANPRANMFGTRIFMGNQFNPYAAFELGGIVFSNLRYDAHGVPVYGGTDVRVRALDLTLKGIFAYRMINIYGKVGMAATYLTSGGSFNPSFKPATINGQGQPVPSKLKVSTTYKKKFSPVYSIGASYDINQSWEIDASYNTYQIGENVGNLTFYAIGFAYHFTDKYCGQFLCDD